MPDGNFTIGPTEKGLKFEALTAAWFKDQFDEVIRVWPHSEFPYRTGPDVGIDLWAETDDGRFWAIQCKDWVDSVGVGPVQKLVAEAWTDVGAGKTPADRSYIATRFDRFTANARRAMDQHQVHQAVIGDYSPEQAPAVVNLPSLFPDQDGVVYNCWWPNRHLARSQILAACGFGKTYLQIWITERSKAKTVVVLVPSLALVRQTAAEFRSAFPLPFKALAVCSDSTVLKAKEYVSSVDEMERIREDFRGQVTTDPDVIRSFMDQKGLRVVFATYHSSHRLNGVPFDLGIFDEAHFVSGAAAVGDPGAYRVALYCLAPKFCAIPD